MNMMTTLFIMFAKLSAFSFGGGYVMIPIMMQELEKNGLIDPSKVTDVVAIAGMSPGPVAVNAAVGLGYYVSQINNMGAWGILPAFLGIALPCAIIVIVAATFFFNVYKNKHVQAALYGLRPAIAGIVLYAAVKLAMGNGIFFSHIDTLIKIGYNVIMRGYHIAEVKSLVIFAATFLLLTKTKIHPIFLILSAGIAGIFLFRF